MAKSKNASPAKRKKAHKPKGFDRNAAFHVIRGHWRAQVMAANDGLENGKLRECFMQPVGADQQEELFAEYRAALVRMRINVGDLEDWNMVLNALNTGLILCERGFGHEYLPTFMAALDQMADSRVIYDATGVWEWSAKANEEINDCIDVHAAQLEAAMQADVLSAMAEVAKRIEQQQVITKEAA